MTKSAIGLYARVSSDRQAQEGTIDSQLAQLREYSKENHYEIQEDLIFLDNGVSGASLIRPALESLRDKAFLGLIKKLVVLCPDRLSRKYAHQLILVEEFQKLGVEIIFVNRQLGSTPEDQLLFQIQGVISEYEREKIMERSRRGKLHKAKTGRISIMSAAPYGYHYIPVKQFDDAQWTANDEESKIVKRIFFLCTEENLTIGKIATVLNKDGVKTRTEKNQWCRSTIGAILRNSAYIGKATYRKTQAVPRKRFHARPGGEKYSRVINSSSISRPKNEWIIIPVPAIVDELTFEKAQEKLIENKRFASRNNSKHNYLASGLLRCKACGLGYYGVARPGAKKESPFLLYYRCHGSNASRNFHIKRCESRWVRADIVDDLVWEQTKQLIQNPKSIFNEHSSRIKNIEKHENNGERLITQKHKEIKQLDLEKERVIDLFQSGHLEKLELEKRIKKIQIKQDRTKEELTMLDRENKNQENKLSLIERLESFTRKINDNVQNLSYDKKRELVKLLVNEIQIDSKNAHLDIRHIVPISTNGQLCPPSGCIQVESHRTSLF